MTDFPEIGARLSATLALLLAMSAFAMADEEAVSDPHKNHRMAMAAPNVQVERHTYEVPDVELLNEKGEIVRLRDILASNRAVALNFIFTSCTTICPVMTATMLQLQGQLAGDGELPAFVSISIDPDYDSATVLRKYAASYGADWTFLTGSNEDITRAMQAFDAYRGSKVNHFALTLMKAADEIEWTRIEGLTSASQLAQYWRDIGS